MLPPSLQYLLLICFVWAPRISSTPPTREPLPPPSQECHCMYGEIGSHLELMRPVRFPNPLFQILQVGWFWQTISVELRVLFSLQCSLYSKEEQNNCQTLNIWTSCASFKSTAKSNSDIPPRRKEVHTGTKHFCLVTENLLLRAKDRAIVGGGEGREEVRRPSSAPR